MFISLFVGLLCGVLWVESCEPKARRHYNLVRHIMCMIGFCFGVASLMVWWDDQSCWLNALGVGWCVAMSRWSYVWDTRKDKEVAPKAQA